VPRIQRKYFAPQQQKLLSCKLKKNGAKKAKAENSSAQKTTHFKHFI